MATRARWRRRATRCRHCRRRCGLRSRAFDNPYGRSLPELALPWFRYASSFDEARRNAASAGVAERVAFDVARAVDYPGRNYGLIGFFDCLHDMGDPVTAARHAARRLAPGGTVMLVEPFANDRVEENISPVARFYYAASTTLCCAHAISDGGNLVLGAQAGEERLADVFRKAGFTHFRRAVKTPFNLILEARR